MTNTSQEESREFGWTNYIELYISLLLQFPIQEDLTHKERTTQWDIWTSSSPWLVLHLSQHRRKRTSMCMFCIPIWFLNTDRVSFFVSTRCRSCHQIKCTHIRKEEGKDISNGSLWCVLPVREEDHCFSICLFMEEFLHWNAVSFLMVVFSSTLSSVVSERFFTFDFLFIPSKFSFPSVLLGDSRRDVRFLS